MRGLFVTGTDTGVGKTALSGALVAAMAAAGVQVRAHKPAVTGLDEHASTEWPPDHELLAAASGMSPEQVAPLRFGPAVSPHLAAEMAGERIEPQCLRAAVRAAGAHGPVVVEGAGGLLSPLAEDYTVGDLALALGLPVLIAARPGLGTINHSLLTLRAARAIGLDVLSIVLTPWPAEPCELELSNRDAIERMGRIEVQSLEAVSSPAPAELARAGGALPWRHWLAASEASSLAALAG